MKRIGNLNGKPIIQGDENLLKKNIILYKENNGKIELSERRDNGKINNITQGNNNNSNYSSGRIMSSDIVSIKQITYKMNESNGMSQLDKQYDITSLINYSEELGVFVISKTDYDEIKQRDSYSSELYFLVHTKSIDVEYSLESGSNIKVTTVVDKNMMQHKFYYRYVPQDYIISDFKNYYKEFYLMVL